MFGMALTRPSLAMQLRSGVDVFVHVCRQTADTSSNYCDNIQPYDKSRFCFSQMWHDFRLFFWRLAQCHTSNFRKLGSAPTYWRYVGKYYVGFVGNLLGFPAVKEFWKSVKNWQTYQTYRHEFGVLLSYATVYLLYLSKKETCPVLAGQFLCQTLKTAGKSVSGRLKSFGATVPISDSGTLLSREAWVGFFR